MSDFENKVSSRGILYSRYIASWYISGGDFGHPSTTGFMDWLRSTGLSDDEAYEIWYIATTGKLELEQSAESYLSSNEEAIENHKKRRRKRHARF